MRTAVATRLRALLGAAAIDHDAAGVPRATPENAEALSLVCRLAYDEGWKIRVEGRGTWLAPDAPADAVVTTRGLEEVLTVSARDLVATVQAGATLDVVRRRLADEGMWLPLDPPGRPDRSLGSVIATGTSGPLRNGVGGVRDQVLGCTTVTGDGRIVKSGGRVVKNVAGYDLTKLHVGGFGGFGIITEVHLRLRAAPRADTTLLARGPRDALTSAARDLVAANLVPVAFELMSPALAAESDWTLAVRLSGTDEGVAADAQRVTGEASLPWERLPPERSTSFWGLAARGALAGPLTLRLGVLPDGIDEMIDLVGRELDEGLVSASAGAGTLRWSGDAPIERLRAVRRTAATREVPMTLERGPWELRAALGHFGAYREGVGQLVGRLRTTFDPKQCLSVALEGVQGG